jgi:hypothetical protein
MKSLPMIAGMMLATAMAPVWAAEKAQPAESGANPPATVAWGAVTNELQAGLVPLGGIKGWVGFVCPVHAKGVDKSRPQEEAAAKRICVGCTAPKPWSAMFVEGEPLRMELHFRNLAKEACSLYDASHGEHWSFTFTQVGGGKVWKTSWSREDERTMEGIARSTISLAVGQQNAVEMGLERHSLGLLNPDGGQPASRTLPPGKYTVTASYAHPEHAQRKPCTYWHGMVTTSPVEIEIKPNDADARFLEAAKYAGFAAVAVVKKLPQGGDKTKPAQLGIEWGDRLYAPEIARNELSDVRALSLEDGPTAANLQLGDRILVTVDQQQVMILALSKRLDKSSLNGAKWISWSQSRQEALEAVLAPGWREGCCPWCRRGARPDYPVCACRDGCGGEGCTQNRRNRGECMTCERKVGPATRDVTFRLWAYDPTVPQAKTLPNTCRIQAGAVFLPLWVEVQNEKGATPEFMTPGGGKRFDRCNTLFCLVEGPGLSSPTAAFRCELARTMAPSALQQGSAVGPVELIAGTLFAAPGTYRVCAVAGRLVSNPIKIIVEPDTAAQGKSKQEAEAKAQIERGQQTDREREMKERAIRERGQ